jgi:hypothetical protein
MIARPENFPASGSSSPDLSGAETPLQRQIILWQRELLRRAERRQRIASPQSDWQARHPERSEGSGG